MTRYGQLVVGPPACGKTTYCNGLAQFMRQMGRTVAIVNLDFANEQHDWDPNAGQGGEEGDVSGSDSDDANTTTTNTSGQRKKKADKADSDAPKQCAVDVRQLVRYVCVRCDVSNFASVDMLPVLWVGT
jgi:GTPase SAR1 family protein